MIEALNNAAILEKYARPQPLGDGVKPTASKWEYDFVLASEMGTTKFVAFLRDRESRGWEFNGQVTLLHQGKDAPHWLSRRPTPQARTDRQVHDAWAKTFHQHLDAASCVKCHQSSNEGMYRRMLLDVYDTVPPKPAAAAPADPAAHPDPPATATPQVRAQETVAQAAAAEREPTLRAEVRALRRELERLRGTPKSVTLPKASLGLSPHDMQRVLHALAVERFGADGKKPLTLEASDTELTLRGSPEVVDWAAETAKKLSRREK